MKNVAWSLRRSYYGRREGFLLRRIKSGHVPEHVAIIMDGNGRWAARRRLSRSDGHRAGAEAIRRAIAICPEVGVRYLTIYAFSRENWRRPKEEVDDLMSLFEEMLKSELDELDRQGVWVRAIGRLNELPESVQRAFREADERTRGNDTLVLNVALNYSGRVEIADAVRTLAGEVAAGRLAPDAVDDEAVGARLLTAGMPDPELLIRTSGEVRVSNFLLWQIAYSEIWVTPMNWPSFGRADFLMALADFQKRGRRFGGVEDIP